MDIGNLYYYAALDESRRPSPAGRRAIINAAVNDLGNHSGTLLAMIEGGDEELRRELLLARNLDTYVIGFCASEDLDRAEQLRSMEVDRLVELFGHPEMEDLEIEPRSVQALWDTGIDEVRVLALRHAAIRSELPDGYANWVLEQHATNGGDLPWLAALIKGPLNRCIVHDLLTEPRAASILPLVLDGGDWHEAENGRLLELLLAHVEGLVEDPRTERSEVDAAVERAVRVLVRATDGHQQARRTLAELLNKYLLEGRIRADGRLLKVFIDPPPDRLDEFARRVRSGDVDELVINGFVRHLDKGTFRDRQAEAGALVEGLLLDTATSASGFADLLGVEEKVPDLRRDLVLESIRARGEQWCFELVNILVEHYGRYGSGDGASLDLQALRQAFGQLSVPSQLNVIDSSSLSLSGAVTVFGTLSRELVLSVNPEQLVRETDASVVFLQLQEEFQESAEAWEVFTVLAKDHNGTLLDLVTSTLALVEHA